MDVVVVEFEGGIEEFPRLIQTVDLLLADGERRLILDLHQLPFMNSAALGYLIKTQQTLNTMHGQLGLAGVQPAIRNILTVTHLDQLFRMYPSVEKALEDWGVHAHLPPHPEPASHGQGGAAKAPKVTRKRITPRS